MVFGLTTAATLWIAASIGMACGAGMYDVAIIATVLSVAVLTLIRILERQLLPSSGKQVRRCKIVIYLNGNDVEKIYNFLNSYVDNMTDFSSKKLLENPEKSKVSSIFVIVSITNNIIILYKYLFLKLQVQKYLGRLSLIGCKGKEKER